MTKANPKTEEELTLEDDTVKIQAWIKKAYKKKATQVKILDKTSILYEAWECDPKIWLVRVNDEILVLGTDHGSGYEVLSKKMLDSKIDEYAFLIKRYTKWLAKITEL